jgi:NAD(P)-dependent dehydrogenase (short-subunit alcohol dehydrogenase family)
VNLKGMFLTVQACARQMVRQNRGGRIVTLSSVNAVKGARCRHLAVNASILPA